MTTVEILGKWSLVDIFSLTIWASALHLETALGTVEVSAQIGSVLFCIAVVLSMLLTAAVNQHQRSTVGHESAMQAPWLYQLRKQHAWVLHGIFILLSAVAVVTLCVAIGAPAFVSTTEFIFPDSSSELGQIATWGQLQDSKLENSRSVMSAGAFMLNHMQQTGRQFDQIVGYFYLTFVCAFPAMFLVCSIAAWAVASTHPKCASCLRTMAAILNQASCLDVWTCWRLEELAGSISVAGSPPGMISAHIVASGATCVAMAVCFGCLQVMNALVMHGIPAQTWGGESSRHLWGGESIVELCESPRHVRACSPNASSATMHEGSSLKTNSASTYGTCSTSVFSKRMEAARQNHSN